MRLIASLAAAFFALNSQAKEFRAADIQPDDYPTVLAVRYMGDQIKQKTGGNDSI